MRAYQREAVEGFWAGGSGVIVLPSGAGKTSWARPPWRKPVPPR